MGTQDLYRLAWRWAPRLPASIGYGVSHLGADVAWALQRLSGFAGSSRTGGVPQLRRNLARLLEPGTCGRELEAATRAGMRSYMRYFYEAFALSGLSATQVDARVRAVLDPRARQDLEAGSIVVALAHMGNWDLVGAWASRVLVPVLTVAERLEPEDLFDQFVSFRQSLGMRVIGQARGQKVFDQLLEAAGEGRYLIALLADRDLSSSGVEVPLAGRKAHVAAGPAAVAERLDLPLYVATVSYERLTGERRRQAGGPWGVVLTLSKVPRPEGAEGRELVARWTRSWVAALEPGLRAHAVDWHMLQAVFDEDLDQARLARSRAREAAGGAEGPDNLPTGEDA
ncbi:phosphatidylinositol mannoside acyltransferase [Actinomyces faecalis]|uniref:phosphatidylinositol mannoside acyltransferase n=1 Tax=Actinomyces faecalis TaxID=2722820 RepID=UPI001556C148|nr:phosphatidylinositol mannoside acyltransferase [Actinomyces faecalis]